MELACGALAGSLGDPLLGGSGTVQIEWIRLSEAGGAMVREWTFAQ